MSDSEFNDAPHEVSAVVGLEENRLEAKLKSKAIAALDRLIGGLIGIPASYFEGVEQRIRAQNKRLLSIQNTIAEKVQVTIEDSETIDEAVLRVALAHNLKPIINKKYVADYAIQDLNENPNGSEASDEPFTLDDQWLNQFERYAELASTDYVRRLWGRILAGEIRGAGTFSLSTLRLLTELDQEMTELFQEEAKLRMNNAAIFKPANEKMRGEKLASLSFLAEIGLLQSIDAIGGVQLSLNPDEQNRVVIDEQNLLLVIESTRSLNLPVINLTRAGRELATILPPVDPVVVLERAFDEIHQAYNDVVQSGKILKVLHKDGNTVHFDANTTVKILKEKLD